MGETVIYRPAPLRCTAVYGHHQCDGIIFVPAEGERAEVIRRVRHHRDAGPRHHVASCGRCGRLYELRITAAEEVR